MRRGIRWFGFMSALVAMAVLSACQTSQVPGGVTVTTVNGVVLDAAREPLANASVVIDGSAVVTTDATGGFSVPDISVPYDVSIVPDGSNRVAVYMGLTRSDPVLLGIPFGTITLPPSPYSATISGTLSGGGGFPQPVGAEVDLRVRLDTADATLSSSTTSVDSSTGEYTVQIGYGGNADVSVTIHALQAEPDGTGGYANVHGYGASAQIAVTDGGTSTGQDIAMTAVTLGSVSGEVTPPTGFTPSPTTATLVLADGTVFGLGSSTTTPTFDFLTPVISGSTVSVSASATDADGRVTRLQDSGVPTSATGLDLVLREPPMLLSPPDGATGVDVSTEFSWTEFGDGLHIAAFFPDVSTDPSFYVFTAAGSVTIPDLATLGLGLPSSAAYEWGVIGVLPITTVDEIAAPGTSPIFGGPTVDVATGSSVARTFTTD